MKKIIGAIIAVVIIWYISYVSYLNYQSEQQIERTLNENTQLQEAYFAGWCFWCVESSFEKHAWIIDAISWYAGGEEKNPKYKQVASGNTGHREAVKVIYDPSIITYNDLLQILWRTANPTDDSWQYVDRWFQYTSAIFYSSEIEKELSEISKQELEKSGRFEKEIITPILAFKSFYPAEEYHQNFYKKNPVRYNVYTNGSWRKEFLESVWWEDLEYKLESYIDKEELKTRLTDLQYEVTQNAATEPSFDNAYWDNKKEWIYVDIVDGSPLYSSTDKFDSGTGWPSFTKSITPENLVLLDDYKLIIKRTEVRSKKANSHLGHIFNDAPKELGGIRHCINSAALDFIPKEELEEKWYGEYLYLFE